ncbi:MAG: hypothetical protein AB7O37_15765 [Vicinamibacteria bacterium]
MERLPPAPPARVSPWPLGRNHVEAVLGAGVRYPAHAFGELDVTQALARIRFLQRELRQALSVHAWLIHCLSRAVLAVPEVQSYRHGRRLVVMSVVDVGTIVERRVDGYRAPVAYVVRDAGSKSHAELQLELRAAVRQQHRKQPLWQLLARLPRFVRRALWRVVQSNPEWHRRHMMGTIGLTSLQLPGLDFPFCALPPTPHTLSLAVGSLAERVALDTQGRPERRQVLLVGGAMDHLMIDGMTAARFAREFGSRVQGALDLDEAFAREMRERRAALDADS